MSDAVAPWNTGGKETRITKLTEWAQAQGLDVHVYTMHWWDEPDSSVTLNGITYHALMKKRPLYSGSRRSISQGCLFGVAVLRLFRCDFAGMDVDSMPFFPVLAAKLICLVRGKTFVSTWHEVWGKEYWIQYLGPILGRLAALVERAAIRCPERVIANSPSTAARLSPLRAGVGVVCVPSGVEVAALGSTEPASDRYDVMYAGRLLQNKQVDLLLEALDKLKRSGIELSCLIVGDGPERSRLISMTESLGLGRVDFQSFDPNASSLFSKMRAASVFALPSLREGFGLVVLEANACGTPVLTITHPNNAAADLIVPGRNGEVVDNSANAFAAGLSEMVSNASTYNARSWVEENADLYDWQNVARRHIAAMTMDQDVHLTAPGRR